ncbi:MAG: von Willebrand factor type A domain-containing protein [Polyangiaceae bacterium]
MTRLTSALTWAAASLALSTVVACGSDASSSSGTGAEGGTAPVGGSGPEGGSSAFGGSGGGYGEGGSYAAGGTGYAGNGGSGYGGSGANGGSGYGGTGGGYGTGGSGGGYGSAGTAQGGAAGSVAVPQENDWIETAVEDTSTFGADVDTGSYTSMRQSISGGSLPDPLGVRVEEYTNYFRYQYPEPTTDPFSVSFEMAPSKFGEANQDLFRIGIKGKQVPPEERKPANLVFLIDASGSMSATNKLPLIQWSLRQLVKRLEPTDRLGIVVYAGDVRFEMQPTEVSDKSEILDQINRLEARGGTNGAAGIQTAYAMAESAYRSNGINRVVLCTDGDFNVGLTGNALISEIEEYRDKGVTLSVLGFGNSANDAFMEQLADHGNGNYALIDNQNEAMHVLGDNLVSTLQVIAKDVKIQVEFNQDTVQRYRLIGYENRVLDNSDFTNDAVDSGDLGAGHFVTSFYELERDRSLSQGRMATVRLRYKEPDGDVSQELTFDFDLAAAANSFDAASSDFRFAAGVVEFAEILRGSKHSQGQRFDDVLQIVSATQGEDNLRKEFYGLVVQGSQLSH